MEEAPRPPPGEKTICLCMIVKNETAVLPHCFDRVLAAVPGLAYWVVCDTGSTDGTQAFVRAYFAGKGVPGELHEDPWKDFAHNRTLAFRRAKGKSDYIFVLDADDVVEGRLALGEKADALAYRLELRQTTLVYRRTQVFRGDCDWRYVGVVHEYPELVRAPPGAPNRRTEFLGGCRVTVRMCGARSRGATSKFERDIRLLLRGLAAEPENRRYHYYLANSYRDNGELGEAIPWYEKRAAMGGWAEEAAHARYRVGLCKLRLRERGRPVSARPFDAEERGDFMAAFRMFGRARLEPLYQVLRHYRLAGRHEEGAEVGRRGMHLLRAAALPPGLFVERDVYEYRFADELSVAAYWAGDFRLSYEMALAAYAPGRYPPEKEDRLWKNLDFSAAKAGEALPPRGPAGRPAAAS